MKINKTIKAKSADFVKNGHRTRERFQKQNVGLLAVGSYVCPTINVAECERLVQNMPEKPVAAGVSGYVVLKGTDMLVRAVKKFGDLYMLNDGSFVTELMFPKGSFEFIKGSDLKSRLRKESFGVTLFFKALKSEITGLVLGTQRASGRGTVFSLTPKGNLKLHDFETRSNKHNGHLLASVVSVDEPVSELYRKLSPALA